MGYGLSWRVPQEISDRLNLMGQINIKQGRALLSWRCDDLPQGRALIAERRSINVLCPSDAAVACRVPALTHEPEARPHIKIPVQRPFALASPNTLCKFLDKVDILPVAPGVADAGGRQAAGIGGHDLRGWQPDAELQQSTVRISRNFQSVERHIVKILFGFHGIYPFF
uniref:Uncharacterized protein n=1 Tax=mine drainage metagenome TaxID=410659 RepID=E6PPY9_9ZZZZ